MSRSKKNWDHLVNRLGNYIDLNDNKGTKGGLGVKGQKGGPGAKGDKGEPLGIFRFRGTIPTYNDLFTGVVLPKAVGDIWLVVDINTLYVWTAAGWVTLRQGVGAVLKGEKGEKGVDVKGEKGEGVKGQKGSKGFLGDEGEKGEEGEKGRIGTKGLKGQKGQKGRVGDAFEYDDFTPAQLDGLKVKGDKGYGDKGEKGEKGDEFEYTDFTPDQLKGLQVKGEKGEKGDRGYKGDEFEFSDFTPDQLKGLQVKGDQGQKGEIGKGEKGKKGDNLVFDDLDPSQKLEIQGDKGDKGDKGEDVLTILEKGGILPPGSGPGDLAEVLKGDKGYKGSNGFGVTLKGSVPTYDDLPELGMVDGDLWVTEDDYHAYVWADGGWVDLGAFTGPPGTKGDVGPEGPKGEIGPIAMPVGSIVAFPGTTIPTGWLLCDGSPVPGGNPILTSIVGSNLPNLKGRFLGGAGSNDLALGGYTNDSTRKPRKSNFSLSSGSAGGHSHSFSGSGTTGSGGRHTHNMGSTANVSGDKSGGRFYPSTNGPAKTSEHSGHTHSFSVSGSTGSVSGHTHSVSSSNWDSYTRPHAYAVNYIIKSD